MKTLYISLLSVAFIAQASYFCYDYLAKKSQSELNDSFREQTARTLSQLEIKTDKAVQDERELKEVCSTAVNEAVKTAATQLKLQLEDRLAELQKHQAQSPELSAQTERDMVQSRQQTDAQTNYVIGLINKLRLDTLSRLQDAETELALLEKQQMAGISDREFLKRQIQKSVALFDPDRH